MKSSISSHPEFDKHGYWVFERQYPYPIETERRINVDAIVVGVCIVCAAAGLIVAAVTGAL